VLGTLFSSNGYQKHETDLEIIVTPNLVRPAGPGDRLATPLDSHLPSNDVDFFLKGETDVKKNYFDFIANGGGLQGPYGHLILPEPHSSDPGAVR
jgi:pilus assembly protein CpaC